MGYLFKLAWRNAGRNRRRSLAAVISVTLSILFVVFMQGMIGGFMGSMVKNYTRSETGHVRLTSTDFEQRTRFLPVTKNVADGASIVKALREDEQIASQIDVITQRISFGVMLSHDGANKSALALAGDPEAERGLLFLDKSVLPGGRYLEHERELMMGAGLASALKYKVGDTVSVMTQGSDSALHLRKFTLVGIFKSGLKTLDDKVFQIGLADAQHLLRMGDDTQQIIVMLKDYQAADQVADLIRARIARPELAVTSWTKIGDTYRLVSIAGRMYNVIFTIVALLGAIIIGNIMMMVIMERKKEIGIMRSMGFSRREILILFATEGTILGLVGSLVGTTIGLVITVIFHYRGIDFSAMNQVGSFPMDNIIYFKVDPWAMLKAVMLGTVISALVAMLPSRRAARMGIVEAIKAV